MLTNKFRARSGWRRTCTALATAATVSATLLTAAAPASATPSVFDGATCNGKAATIVLEGGKYHLKDGTARDYSYFIGENLSVLTQEDADKQASLRQALLDALEDIFGEGKPIQIESWLTPGQPARPIPDGTDPALVEAERQARAEYNTFRDTLAEKNEAARTNVVVVMNDAADPLSLTFEDSTICGSSFDDKLVVNGDGNTVYGLDGDDQISGNANATGWFHGGNGNDYVHGGGNSTSWGNRNLYVYGDAGDDVLAWAKNQQGGTGDDKLVDTTQKGSLSGGAGYDILWSQGGGDVISGIEKVSPYTGCHPYYFDCPTTETPSTSAAKIVQITSRQVFYVELANGHRYWVPESCKTTLISDYDLDTDQISETQFWSEKAQVQSWKSCAAVEKLVRANSTQ